MTSTYEKLARDVESGSMPPPPEGEEESDAMPPHILARASLIYLSKEETLRIGIGLSFLYYGLTGLVSLAAPAEGPNVAFYGVCIAIGVGAYLLFYLVKRFFTWVLRSIEPRHWKYMKRIRKWHDRMLAVAYTIPASAINIEDPPIGRIVDKTTPTPTLTRRSRERAAPPPPPPKLEPGPRVQPMLAGGKLELQQAIASINKGISNANAHACMIVQGGSVKNNNYNTTTTARETPRAKTQAVV